MSINGRRNTFSVYIQVRIEIYCSLLLSRSNLYSNRRLSLGALDSLAQITAVFCVWSFALMPPKPMKRTSKIFHNVQVHMLYFEIKSQLAPDIYLLYFSYVSVFCSQSETYFSIYNCSVNVLHRESNVLN